MTAPGSSGARGVPPKSVGVDELAGRFYRNRYPGFGTALGVGVTAGNVGYFPVLGGAGGGVVVENTVTQRLERAGTSRLFRVYVSANAATGGTLGLRANALDIATLNLAGLGTGWQTVAGATNLALVTDLPMALRVSPTGGTTTVDGSYLEVDDV